MKVHLRMVGCRLNQSEIDTMARQFSALGHEVVDSPADADHFVINTCAVTNEAAKTSRKLIRDFQRANPKGETTATGCYAQIAPREIGLLPGVRRVVVTGRNRNWSRKSLANGLTFSTANRTSAVPLPVERAPSSKRKTAATMHAPSASRRLRAARAAVARLARSSARSIICGEPAIKRRC